MQLILQNYLSYLILTAFLFFIIHISIDISIFQKDDLNVKKYNYISFNLNTQFLSII